MTDFRALCAELLDELDYQDWGTTEGLKDRARAALAESDGPVVQSREPASVTTEPSDEELWELYQGPGTFSPIEFARAVLARWGNCPAQPVPVSERLPEQVQQALLQAECALSDIAEGEPEEDDGDSDDLLTWAENRAADTLARIRPVMRLHQIQTSEWPPLHSGEVE